VSSKEGMFFEKKILRVFEAEIFFCCGRSYCTDPYDSVQTYRFGKEIKVIFGTIFAVVFRLSVAVFGPYRTVRSCDCGHEKQGMKEVGQRYGFGTKNEADLCGTDLVL
jgi:hypothetical protein